MNRLTNIINLSKIFIKENENNFNVVNLEEKKINKKSIMFWMIIILFLGISYISNEVISYLSKIGKPQIFLNGYFLFLEILMVFQSIMVCTNIFYFSKNIENILHLPFKPKEILISKFNVLLFMLYGTELIFGLTPFFIYGGKTHMEILYYINLIFSLIIFPIFSALIISIIMMFLMKTIKLFKNKNTMQLIISSILIFIVIVFAIIAIKFVFINEEIIESGEFVEIINNKIININKYFLTINPITNLLQQKNILIIFMEFLKLIFINLILFICFIFLGNKLYLKQLLKANFYIKNKNNKKINLNKKIKNNKLFYIKKEFKLLLKNPLFFIQNIYPVILMTIMVFALFIVMVPKYMQLAQLEEYKELFASLKFDMEVTCIIVGLIQVVTLFNYSSITCFSREGVNAYVMKYIPVSLYKQFLYKNIPQVFVNTICSIFILGIIYYEIPAIGLKYIFTIFILAFLLILINSFILSLIDLLKPNLNWDAEYELLKNNRKKILQYVLIVFNIVFLYYFNSLFENHNLDKCLILFIFILLFIFIAFNLILFKLKNKLYKKIN